jgi:hypothetical protein
VIDIEEIAKQKIDKMLFKKIKDKAPKMEKTIKRMIGNFFMLSLYSLYIIT